MQIDRLPRWSYEKPSNGIKAVTMSTRLLTTPLTMWDMHATSEPKVSNLVLISGLRATRNSKHNIWRWPAMLKKWC